MLFFNLCVYFFFGCNCLIEPVLSNFFPFSYFELRLLVILPKNFNNRYLFEKKTFRFYSIKFNNGLA